MNSCHLMLPNNYSIYFILEYYNQSSLTDALLEKEVDRILFPNYLDYLFHLRKPQFRKKFKSKYKIATVMHKPFDIGFAAISYDEWASANDVFFGNLEFHILRSEKEVSWKRISFEEKLV